MMTSFARACGQGLAILAAAALLAGGAQAHSHKFKNLEIVHPWCVETQEGTTTVAVYMTIRSSTRRPDRLLRVSTPIAGKAELRGAAATPGAESKPVAAIDVKRGDLDLKRGGPHVLLSGVKKQLGPYEGFVMTLEFERAGKVEVEVAVEEASILEPAKH